ISAFKKILKDADEVGPRLALRSAMRIDNDWRQTVPILQRKRSVEPRRNRAIVKTLVANQLRLDEFRERDAGSAGLRQLLQFVAGQVPNPHIHVVAWAIEDESQLVIVLRKLQLGDD